jgi:cytochrome oxidase Cu insertion factor (SCO1/SenC/PrrC family)
MAKVFVLAFSIIAVLAGAANVQAQANTKPVAVGEAAPDFSLMDNHGAKVTLSDSRGRNPVVLVFYRGYW